MTSLRGVHDQSEATGMTSLRPRTWARSRDPYMDLDMDPYMDLDMDPYMDHP